MDATLNLKVGTLWPTLLAEVFYDLCSSTTLSEGATMCHFTVVLCSFLSFLSYNIGLAGARKLFFSPISSSLVLKTSRRVQ